MVRLHRSRRREIHFALFRKHVCIGAVSPLSYGFRNNCGTRGEFRANLQTERKGGNGKQELGQVRRSFQCCGVPIRDS